jgi:hypothetical protein
MGLFIAVVAQVYVVNLTAITDNGLGNLANPSKMLSYSLATGVRGSNLTAFPSKRCSA